MLGASFPARLGLLVPTGGARAGSVRGSGSTRNDGAQGAHVSLTLADVARSRRSWPVVRPRAEAPQWGPRGRSSVLRRPSHGTAPWARRANLPLPALTKRA